MTVSIAVIGECMLELTHGERISKGGRTRPMGLSYGGDSLNTAIYLARSDVQVSYLTALGDDIMSDWLLEEWQSEGIDCSLVDQVAGAAPGMYMVNVDDTGERSFLYWRKHSPASQMFASEQKADLIAESIAGYDYVYLSGISLAILDTESQERVFKMLKGYRDHGGKIVFDGNYRPRLWSSKEQAQLAYARMYQLTHIALPTLEDEADLFGFETPGQVLKAIQEHEVPEIIVKMGGEGCLAYTQGETNKVAAEHVTPVDTTAAGDSFNAGYLTGRFTGCNQIDACLAGHKLAGKVIQHPGAIIPLEKRKARTLSIL